MTIERVVGAGPRRSTEQTCHRLADFLEELLARRGYDRAPEFRRQFEKTFPLLRFLLTTRRVTDPALTIVAGGMRVSVSVRYEPDAAEDLTPPITALLDGIRPEDPVAVRLRSTEDVPVSLRAALTKATAGTMTFDLDVVRPPSNREPGDREPGDREPGDRGPGDHRPWDPREPTTTADHDELLGMDRILGKITDSIDGLPRVVRRAARPEVDTLLAILRDRRSPRIMLVGRRGSGKSKLINALAGAPLRGIGAARSQTGSAAWETLTFGGRRIEVLDTRGIQEGSRPAEADDAATPEASVLAAVEERCPDVILFLVKAKEVDSAIDGDLAALETVHRAAMRAQRGIHDRFDVKIVPVLSQCDEMDPSHCGLAEDHPDKTKNIEEARAVLAEHLSARPYLNAHLGSWVVPVSALLEFGADGRPIPDLDRRWNVDRLAGVIQDVIPNQAVLEYVRVAQFRQVQQKFAGKVTLIFAGICGAVGAEPLPLADLPVLTTLQVMMVIVIAYISGREASAATAREFLVAIGANVGAAFVLREAARALVRLVPVAGNAVSGAVAAGSTKVIGQAASHYFIEKASAAEVRSVLQTGVKQIETGPDSDSGDA